MDGHPLTVAEVERIADLESREVLLAKLAGAMKGNLAKAAGLFNAPASQVARLVGRAAGKEGRGRAAAPPRHRSPRPRPQNSGRRGLPTTLRLPRPQLPRPRPAEAETTETPAETPAEPAE